MRRWVIAGILFLFSHSSAADKSIELGVGLDYTPIGLLRFDYNSNADYELVDNIAWQGRLSYNFGNGFKSGLIFDYMAKKIHPGPHTTFDLTLWNIGLTGNYGTEITESGHTLLIAGMESGYGNLSDKSGEITKSGGALWAAGMVGTRFLIGGKIWLDIAYRLGWQQFSIAHYPSRKYRFAGSSLRVSLDIPIYRFRDKGEEK
jgi:hypothetical protein